LCTNQLMVKYHLFVGGVRVVWCNFYSYMPHQLQNAHPHYVDPATDM